MSVGGYYEQDTQSVSLYGKCNIARMIFSPL